MSLLSIRVPKELEKKLAEEAKVSHKKRAQLVREALSAYLRAQERGRFLGEMARAARALATDEGARREALEIAEESVAFDNEALDIAEGRKPGDPWPEERGEKWWK